MRIKMLTCAVAASAALLVAACGSDSDDDATREVDGEEVLDPDANDDQVDSAEADRIAADPDDADDDVLGRS